MHIPGLIRKVSLVACLVIYSLFGLAQKQLPDSFNIHKASFFLPQPLPAFHYSSSISVLYVVTPKDWTLDNITAPMFYYQGKYTLPKNFNLQAGLASLIVSNRIYLGPYWNYDLGSGNYVGIGFHMAWNYGRLNELFGFATIVTGWEEQPSISVGHAFDKTAVTLRMDLYYTSSMNLDEGGNKLTVANDFLNGYSFYLGFEQRLYKNRAINMGIKMDYVQYHIVAWPAFPVNGKRYWMPEFQVGINL